jgi:hypothetical protein
MYFVTAGTGRGQAVLVTLSNYEGSLPSYSGFQAAVDTPAGKIFRFVRPVAPRNF